MINNNQWLKVHKLQLNTEKTKYIILSINVNAIIEILYNNVLIKRVDSNIFDVDENLSWTTTKKLMSDLLVSQNKTIRKLFNEDRRTRINK